MNQLRQSVGHSSAVLRSHPEIGEFGSGVSPDHVPAMCTVHHRLQSKGDDLSWTEFCKSVSPAHRDMQGGKVYVSLSSLPLAIWLHCFGACDMKCIPEVHTWRRPVCLMMSRNQEGRLEGASVSVSLQRTHPQ